eukprot:EG_transcript_8401
MSSHMFGQPPKCAVPTATSALAALQLYHLRSLVDGGAATAPHQRSPPTRPVASPSKRPPFFDVLKSAGLLQPAGTTPPARGDPAPPPCPPSAAVGSPPRAAAPPPAVGGWSPFDSPLWLGAPPAASPAAPAPHCPLA